MENRFPGSVSVAYTTDFGRTTASYAPYANGVFEGSGASQFVKLYSTSAPQGYQFYKWTFIDDYGLTWDSPLTSTRINSNQRGEGVEPSGTLYVVAQFIPTGYQYVVFASSADASKGSVAPAWTVYNLGDPVTFTATPAANCFLSGWRKNGAGNIVSQAQTYTFYPTADDNGATYVASFAEGLLLYSPQTNRLIWDDKKVHCNLH